MFGAPRQQQAVLAYELCYQMAADLLLLGLGVLERRWGMAQATSLLVRESHGSGEQFSGHRKQGWGSQLAVCGVNL